MYDEGVDAFDEGDFDTLMKNVCAFFLSLVFFFPLVAAGLGKLQAGARAVCRSAASISGWWIWVEHDAQVG